MIVRGSEIQEIDHRKGYAIDGVQEQIGHFAVRVTTPDNPFEPEPHGEQRFWYILNGEANVTIDGETNAVGSDDLILLAPWTEHNLRTDTRVRWICFG
ncbi:cupin domain-containing protein [Chloroflexi bacterium TSY]|nr:cupin domain-containing protein [Chloroflexi bacterium TSY]